jgi:signal transduction histidine kinase
VSDARARILHLEDDPRDARLVESQLALAGIECVVTRVDREAAYRQAIEHGAFDLILADHSLPDFDLISALALARRACPDVPFIGVSDTLDEALAVDSLRNGATDHIPKRRLARLAPAVARALAARTERVRRREAEAAAAALEERLRHAQKLEAVGRLAGGIAHDFNNLLTIITGCCDRLLAGLDAGDARRADLELVRQSGERGASLTRQLLAFGRRPVVEPRPIDLNDAVRGIVRILERVLGERIEIVTALGPAPATIEADPGELEQVLMNLAINARDAMPDGGTLTIETSDVDVGPEGQRLPIALPPGRYVVLSVADTGHGMDAPTAARAFEPFFTTKAPGQGTGIGLATVHGIVTRCGGQVGVDSRPGQGTTMRVALPRHGASPAPAAAPAAVRPAEVTRRDTLLLVEDEEFVRDLVRDFLRAAGYQVLEAGSAEEALDLVANRHAPIDLLLTDVVLPGMNGTTLAERLRRQAPAMETVFMSGYPGDSMFGGETFEPGTAFLAKPFTRNQLIDKIAEALARRPASASLVGAG